MMTSYDPQVASSRGCGLLHRAQRGARAADARHERTERDAKYVRRYVIGKPLDGDHMKRGALFLRQAEKGFTYLCQPHRMLLRRLCGGIDQMARLLDPRGFRLPAPHTIDECVVKDGK